MAIYDVYYDYNVGYHGQVEAENKQEALEKFYAMEFVSPPTEGDWDLQDTAEVSLAEEEN
jgi:hypothetical protein